MGLTKTNLESIDFAKLYSEQRAYSTFKGKDSADWDKRAQSMNSRVHASIYTKTFIDKIDVAGATSLLDVGCGPGTISLAISPKLSSIYALDYSQGMLDCLQSNCDERGVNNITTIHKSWSDDWSDVPNTDIVVASRSMEVEDIKDAITKLNSKANKRVYITTKVGGSFLDSEILDQLQREIIPRPDYIYIVNLLHSMGICAKVDFIFSENSKFESASDEEFIQKVSWSLGELSSEERVALRNYFNTTYRYKREANYMKWALISWEIE